jgi:nucleoside phosphorylase
MQRGRIGTARIAVLTILQSEQSAVMNVFSPSYNIPSTGYWCPSAGDFSTVFARSAGRSQVPANDAARRLLEYFRPEILIVLGIGGGFQGRDGLCLGDVVVANYIHYYEFQKWSGGVSQKRFTPFDQPTESIIENHVAPIVLENKWHGAIAEPRPEGVDGDPKVIEGSLVTGEKLLSDPTSVQQQQIVREYSDAVAVDMESYGVARALYESRAAVDYNPRFVVIRGVSDLVSSKARRRPWPRSRRSTSTMASAINQDQRERCRNYAAASAASLASAVIQRLMASTTDPRPTRPRP